jgi:hypothetical protein
MKPRSALAAFLVTVGVLSAAAGQAAGAKAPSGSHAQASLKAAQPRKAGVTPAASVQGGGRVRARRGASGSLRARPKRALAASRLQAEDLLSAALISDKELAKDRGGTETNNTSNATGTVGGNVASQLTTGSNTISQGSFSNSSGIPIVIQNTGNNVLIQNSTILNLQLTKP